jgi:hypothetical protein
MSAQVAHLKASKTNTEKLLGPIEARIGTLDSLKTAQETSIGRWETEQAKLRMNSGGYVAEKFAKGGLSSIKFAPMGSDTIPAMLSPGEFVMRKYAVENFGVDKMKAINSGTYSGESVYNYSVNVNVQTDANADQIARNVMTQIKRIDSQRIRGNRF